jgi:hypothetical protein
MSGRELVEVTEPLGPGLDVEPGPAGAPVVIRARPGASFPGFDRGFLVDSDDGSGRSMRAVVALPTSSHLGCRIEVRWQGVVRDDRGPILVGDIEAGPAATAEALPALVAGGAAEVGQAQEAARLALAARRRFRERRAARRIVGGRAWEMPVGGIEGARFTTAHALPSYALGRLPPRYVLALERLLDPGERVLYAVERPFAGSGGVWRRTGSRDLRAAILVLTDRQVAWVVDHADPDRFLSDWGVDATCVPVERLRRASATAAGRWATVRLETDAGSSEHRLPTELADEARLFANLAARFTPDAAGRLPRRRYPDPSDAVGWSRMDAFGEAASVREMALAVSNHPLAVLPSPARPGHGRTSAWVLDRESVAIVGRGAVERVALADVHAVTLVLSPLEGRAELLGRHPVRIAVPAPYADVAAAFARALRRRLASTPDAAPRR